ncbi:MAG: hypothetical protein IT169_18390 [Bryobacterales bacterium]|nr:hypothetical protein [Bryobacterales bacterium]
MALSFQPTPGGLAIRGIEGVDEALVEGPVALRDAISGGAAAPPDSCYEQSLRITLRLARAGGTKYPLWAFWTRADAQLEPRFRPLAAWRARIAPPCRQSPSLVVARSEGHWDLREGFRPDLAQLLHEKDILDAPDGRMLMSAAPPAVLLRDALSTAIRCFLHSM